MTGLIARIFIGHRRPVTASVMLAAAGLALFTTGCNRVKARDLVTSGLNAMKSQQFTQAVQDFQQAIKLDPTNAQAKQYLASSYQAQLVTGAPVEQNLKIARQAETLYQEIFNQYPDDAADIAGLGSVYLQAGDPAKARALFEKAGQYTPNDPTVHQQMGAVDWAEANQPILAVRASLGATDTDSPIADKNAPSSDKSACNAVRDKFSAEVEAGIQEEQKAISLRADYADAMTYLNLLNRQKADLTCGQDEATRTAALAAANSWSEKAVNLRKIEVAKQNVQGGVVIDTPQSSQ